MVIEAVVHDELSGELTLVESGGNILTVDRAWHQQRVTNFKNVTGVRAAPRDIFEAVVQKRLGGFGMKLDKDAIVLELEDDPVERKLFVGFGFGAGSNGWCRCYRALPLPIDLVVVLSRQLNGAQCVLCLRFHLLIGAVIVAIAATAVDFGLLLVALFSKSVCSVPVI